MKSLKELVQAFDDGELSLDKFRQELEYVIQEKSK